MLNPYFNELLFLILHFNLTTMYHPLNLSKFHCMKAALKKRSAFSRKSLFRMLKLSLPEWLDLEAAVDPEKDPIQPRHLYICVWISQHCDHYPAPELLTASLMYTGKGCTAWGKELLHTIPSIVMSPASSTQATDGVPWLLETWIEISIRFSHQNIFKAVQSLPPWMLLANSPGVQPTPAAIDSLAQFISQQMDKLTEKNFLSLSIVCMVISAVRCVDSSQPGYTLSRIVDSCPSLHLSILRHGQPLQSQLGATFTTSFPLGSNIIRLTNVVSTCRENKQSHSCYNWEVGLARWSQGAPLSLVDDGSLFFHLLDMGNKLLSGSVSMALVSQGPVLPSAFQMATVLVQDPPECLKMLLDSLRHEPQNLPATGLSKHSRAGLSLATMGTLLSLIDDQLPYGETARLCSQVLRQSLNWWKEICLELDPCVPRVREVSFVRWLIKRIHTLTELLITEVSKIESIDID